MTLTSIEKAIYNREVEALNVELRKGVEIIQKAFAKYANGGGYYGNSIRVDDEEKAAAEFDGYINSLKLGHVSYYGGYSITARAPNVSHAPEFLRCAILETAVKEFMASVNQIDEIRHMAEQASNQ